MYRAMKIHLDHLLAACAILACLLLMATALPSTLAETDAGRAALINTCIQDIRKGVKTGQVLSNSQRMQAEEQCRAYAEAQLENARRQPASNQPAANGETGKSPSP